MPSRPQTTQPSANDAPPPGARDLTAQTASMLKLKSHRAARARGKAHTVVAPRAPRAESTGTTASHRHGSLAECWPSEGRTLTKVATDASPNDSSTRKPDQHTSSPGPSTVAYRPSLMRNTTMYSSKRAPAAPANTSTKRVIRPGSRRTPRNRQSDVAISGTTVKQSNASLVGRSSVSHTPARKPMAPTARGMQGHSAPDSQEDVGELAIHHKAAQ
mmetsp:Transcript_73863/g.228184  ORF Transcript_73863/g.228184 Transcript_73863/m.228184 type:complete len:216 (-) Transcript_73863:443-1090(-)